MNEYFDNYENGCSLDSRRIINTPSPTAKEGFFYIQEVGYLKAIEKRHTQRENLDSYLFVIVISGKGKLIYEDKSYTIYENGGFFIDCNKPHLYECSGSDPWEILWVHFNGKSSNTYFKLFRENSSICIDFNEKMYLFKNILNSLIKTNEKKSLSAEILSSKLISELLSDLLLLPESMDNTSLNISDVDDVIKYIDLHFTERITLSDISQEFFISQYHLSREIKRQIGINFSEYLKRRRIEYSKELLRFSRESMERISDRIGINNTSHFIKLFKNMEGMTPLAYRKKWVG